MKCANIKFGDIRGCFYYILNAPRKADKKTDRQMEEGPKIRTFL